MNVGGSEAQEIGRPRTVANATALSEQEGTTIGTKGIRKKNNTKPAIPSASQLRAHELRVAFVVFTAFLEQFHSPISPQVMVELDNAMPEKVVVT
jgi:hypothetical protein